MTTLARSFTTLSDTDLLTAVSRLAADERLSTAQLVASLAELDARRLYLGQGCSSMFTYCTRVLHLSEHAAYLRIEAARAARRFPIIFDRLKDGSSTLTTIGLLATHMTPENHVALLDAARHRSKREVEVLVATLRPQPPVPSSVRKLPTRPLALSSDTASSEIAADGAPPTTTEPRVPGVPDVAGVSDVDHSRDPEADRDHAAMPVLSRPQQPAVVAPLTPDRYKVQVTVSRATVETLGRIQDLMRHTVPDGDPAVIVDRALTLLLAHLERTKLAATDRPRPSRERIPGSRHVPSAVRRAVWARDGRRCAFIGSNGRRCEARGFLELHHTVPYAAGGDATVETIELRCRAHNLYEAELDFGPLIRTRAARGHLTRSGPSSEPEPG